MICFRLWIMDPARVHFRPLSLGFSERNYYNFLVQGRTVSAALSRVNWLIVELIALRSRKLHSTPFNFVFIYRFLHCQFRFFRRSASTEIGFCFASVDRGTVGDLWVIAAINCRFLICRSVLYLFGGFSRRALIPKDYFWSGVLWYRLQWRTKY